MSDDAYALPTDVLQMTPAQAAESFAESEVELLIYETFSGHVDKKEDGDLDWYYELGLMMVEVWKIATGLDNEEGRRIRGQEEGGRSYFPNVSDTLGPKFLERLARSKGFKTTNTLMQAMRVVETWPVKSEYEEVVARRGSGDQRLSWSHICHLCVISDPEERDSLIQECLDESWSVDELFHRLQGHRTQRVTASGETQSPGGRPPKVPRDFRDAFTHISGWCTKSCRLMDRSWLDESTEDGFHLAKVFEDIPQEQYTEDFLNSIYKTETQIEEVLEKLQRLYEVAGDSRKKVQEYRDWLEEQSLTDDLDPAAEAA